MPSLRRARPLLGTLVEVWCDAADDATALAASQAAFAAVARVHAAMSFQEPSSEVGALNRAPVGAWVAVSADTCAVLLAALALSAETGGLFDVCARGATGGWRDLELDADADPAGPRARRLAPLVLDLSGIAKGYAVDAAVAALRTHGATGGGVNAGGDLRVFGATEHTLWVRDPADLSRARHCTVLRDAAAATSASYLLGAPVLRHGVTREPLAARDSWTVVAPTCMAADMLTKVVAASGDTAHPVLARHGARAWLYDAAPRDDHRRVA